jgi:hypothetical protein
MDDILNPFDAPLDEIEQELLEIAQRREERVQAILAKARGEVPPAPSLAPPATPPGAPRPPGDAS